MEKLSKADLKPAVQIKIAAAPEPPISRGKKKEAEPEPTGSLFDDLPKAKPKVKDEFAEKDKKPKEEEKFVITPAGLPKKPESESESEEEEKPEPKKKLSKSDLKPAVQIKMAAAPEPPISRRKKKEPEPEEAGSLFDAPAKSKVKDEF